MLLGIELVKFAYKHFVSSLQAPYKLRTSFVLNLYLNMTESFLFMCGYSCVCSLVQNLTSLATSSLQAPYKLRTSFVFKLVSKLLKNQTCTQVVGHYLGMCGFCTVRFRVVKKYNLYASCTPSDNYLIQVSS
jgi:hypothetical protein